MPEERTKADTSRRKEDVRFFCVQATIAIPTTVGALTSAARSAASQTMASIESQANAAITGLWADASYGKTDFDAYRTDRSGLLFGVQGSTETLTLGAVLSAGTGNVKSDSLVSQDWNDVGGPVYGAYRFGPAALTASALYERHEGKAQGQKRHADVLGASLKVPADAALGGMTVTPYAGWHSDLTTAVRRATAAFAATAFRPPCDLPSNLS